MLKKSSGLILYVVEKTPAKSLLNNNLFSNISNFFLFFFNENAFDKVSKCEKKAEICAGRE